MEERMSDQDYKRWERKAAHFEGKIKWLSSDPIRARYPRYCVFAGLSQEDMHHFGRQLHESDTLFSSLLSTFKASLGSFTNIRYIRLEDIDVDEEVMGAFNKMPLLKTISLQGVNLSCPSPSPLICPTDLRIAEWEPQARVTASLPPLFSIRDLKAIDIQSFRYALPCLQHFLSQGTSKALTTLKIVLDLGIIPTLFAFLETCPNLRDLVACTGRFFFPEFNPTFPPLSSSALPNLCRFEGVASLAAVLVPGRPVDHIVLKEFWFGSAHNEARTSSILHELTKSSATIKSLTLPYMDTQKDIFHAVSKKYPRLESLQFNFIINEADKLDIIDDDSVPDEEYFDLTIPTEIDSIPVDENGCPMEPPTTLKVRRCVRPIPIALIKVCITRV